MLPLLPCATGVVEQPQYKILTFVLAFASVFLTPVGFAPFLTGAFLTRVFFAAGFLAGVFFGAAFFGVAAAFVDVFFGAAFFWAVAFLTAGVLTGVSMSLFGALAVRGFLQVAAVGMALERPPVIFLTGVLMPGRLELV